ncbi:hypothetical protein HJG60_011729 [Phyllostomus discolor]|uniref:Uncharacterized protein n=1 Tax=Phyllostomus discolor TaxID=89673 RepID=A0A833ZWB3_9CHIR|nr:hypothetical protein HJG60_011729 [Phyllostomus discolor]
MVRAGKGRHLTPTLSPNCDGDHTIREPGSSSKDAFSASQTQNSSTRSRGKTGDRAVNSQNTFPYPNMPHHPAMVALPQDLRPGHSRDTHHPQWHQQFQGQQAPHSLIRRRKKYIKTYIQSLDFY